MENSPMDYWGDCKEDVITHSDSESIADVSEANSTDVSLAPKENSLHRKGQGASLVFRRNENSSAGRLDRQMENSLYGDREFAKKHNFYTYKSIAGSSEANSTDAPLMQTVSLSVRITATISQKSGPEYRWQHQISI